jgi:hypothetical protein
MLEVEADGEVFENGSGLLFGVGKGNILKLNHSLKLGRYDGVGGVPNQRFPIDDIKNPRCCLPTFRDFLQSRTDLPNIKASHHQAKKHNKNITHGIHLLTNTIRTILYPNHTSTPIPKSQSISTQHHEHRKTNGQPSQCCKLARTLSNFVQASLILTCLVLLAVQLFHGFDGRDGLFGLTTSFRIIF